MITVTCSNRTGKLAEAMALAAVLQETSQVALPFGNQAGWDLLVDWGEGWKRVQIKKAWRGRQVHIAIKRRNGTLRLPEGQEADLLIAVDVEVGTMWKLNWTQAVGRTVLRLNPEWVWKQGVPKDLEVPVLWDYSPPERQTKPANMKTRRHKLRESLKPLLAGELWTRESLSNQQLATAFVEGRSIKTVATRVGLHESTVKERLERMQKRLSLGV